jgi:hypothetical protein
LMDNSYWSITIGSGSGSALKPAWKYYIRLAVTFCP